MEACAHEFMPVKDLVRGGMIVEPHMVAGSLLQAMQKEFMLGFGPSRASKCIHDATTGTGIKVFHAVPPHSVRTFRDVIKISITNEWPQLRLVKLQVFFRSGMLLRVPGRGVNHYGQPTHHAGFAEAVNAYC